MASPLGISLLAADSDKARSEVPILRPGLIDGDFVVGNVRLTVRYGPV